MYASAAMFSAIERAKIQNGTRFVHIGYDFGRGGSAITRQLYPALNHVLYNPILIVGTLCCLVYFFFSKEHKGATGGAATVGIWFLMVSFGAGYGYTVMSRVSLLIGRFQYLLENWLGLH